MRLQDTGGVTSKATGLIQRSIHVDKQPRLRIRSRWQKSVAFRFERAERYGTVSEAHAFEGYNRLAGYNILISRHMLPVPSVLILPPLIQARRIPPTLC